MSELLIVGSQNIIFMGSRGQKIAKNISRTFSSALHFCMEGKVALTGVHLKFSSFNSSLLFPRQPSENPKI